MILYHGEMLENEVAASIALTIKDESFFKGRMKNIKGKELSLKEIMGIRNIELRRVIAEKVDIATMIDADELEVLKIIRIPKTMDTLEMKKEYVDVYTLYKLEDDYILKVICPSTGREYMIGIPNYFDDMSASKAISWISEAPVSAEAIDYGYRQGDIILLKLKEDSEDESINFYRSSFNMNLIINES